MYSFPKQEHLCSKKLLDELFNRGHRFMVFPYSVHWALCQADELPPQVVAQVLIATSKKKFHHAVDRNHVKRLTRECYRLHKPELIHYLQDNGHKLLLAINYIHPQVFNYSTLYRKFDKLIPQLIREIDKTISKNASCTQ
ncbi:MAG: ribonuclease P protein component [Bacteroidales bacterium]|nr:ribonuclease P protein component [Bacteroidales bacterium]